MTRVRLLLFIVLVALAGAGGWYGWRWWSAPEPPVVVLEGSDPELEEAIETARRKVRQSPYSASAWGNLGMLLRGARRLEPAEQCFAEAERLARDEPRWAYLRGETFLSRDRDAALSHLRRAAELWGRGEPAHVAPWLRAAELLLARGELEEAETDLHRALDADPANPSVHLQLGLLFAAREDLVNARKHLLRAQHSPYTQKQACSKLASVCQKQGDKKAAEEFAARAAVLPTDNDWIDPFVAECLLLVVGKMEKLRRADQLEARGDWGQAAEVLRDLTSRVKDAYAFAGLGRNLLRLGDFDGAEEALKTAVELGENVQGQYLLGQLAMARAKEAEKKGDAGRAKEQYEEATRRAEASLKLKPDYALAHVLRGLALRAIGRKAEGLSALRSAVACGVELSETHLQLGKALAEDGQIVEARKHLEQAVRLAGPNDSLARRELENLPR